MVDCIYTGNGSAGVYAGRLVFFFGPRVKDGWDRAATGNLAAADTNWAALVKQRSVPPLAPGNNKVPEALRACFNTDFLWCLGPDGPQPPPFPACGGPKPVTFGPPRFVDRLEMPTDFLAWTPNNTVAIQSR